MNIPNIKITFIINNFAPSLLNWSHSVHDIWWRTWVTPVHTCVVQLLARSTAVVGALLYLCDRAVGHTERIPAITMTVYDSKTTEESVSREAVTETHGRNRLKVLKQLSGPCHAVGIFVSLVSLVGMAFAHPTTGRLPQASVLGVFTMIALNFGAHALSTPIFPGQSFVSVVLTYASAMLCPLALAGRSFRMMVEALYVSVALRNEDWGTRKVLAGMVTGACGFYCSEALSDAQYQLLGATGRKVWVVSSVNLTLARRLGSSFYAEVCAATVERSLLQVVVAAVQLLYGSWTFLSSSHAYGTFLEVVPIFMLLSALNGLALLLAGRAVSKATYATLPDGIKVPSEESELADVPQDVLAVPVSAGEQAVVDTGLSCEEVLTAQVKGQDSARGWQSAYMVLLVLGMVLQSWAAGWAPFNDTAARRWWISWTVIGSIMSGYPMIDRGDLGVLMAFLTGCYVGIGSWYWGIRSLAGYDLL